MKIVLCISGSTASQWADDLRQAFPAADIWLWAENDTRQADYAVVWMPPAAFFTAQHYLKALFVLGAGVDALLKLPTLPPDLPIVRLNDAGMAIQMAEYVCYALSRFSRRFDLYEAQAKTGQWQKLAATDRQAFPVGVMGLGSIGAKVAQMVKAFEYPVLGWSRTPKVIDGVTTFSGELGLLDFLQKTRVLVCVLPLTADTRHILSRETLGHLKEDAYLINVARGGLLVEDDLLGLLDEGRLAGAMLDVFVEEPLPSSHPFWRHPKIAVTPHISAMTLREESLQQITARLGRLLRGEPLEACGVVERVRGY